MNLPEILLTVAEEQNCPLYRAKDSFTVSGRALSLPASRPCCLVLSDDIRMALSVYDRETAADQDSGAETGEEIPECPAWNFACSGPETGCGGVVHIRVRREMDAAASGPEAEKEKKIGQIIEMLGQFPIFDGLTRMQLRELGTFLKFRKCHPGEIILRKGDDGDSLYILTSGAVTVTDGRLRIAVLGKGEVFGEMSLISGDPVAADITAREEVRLLYIKARNFRRILTRYPSLQFYFGRLLARRLAAMNMAHLRDLSSGVVGSLTDMPPAELFQALNINQKTGTVDITLPGGNARICFRNGEPVSARVGDLTGDKAFFRLLEQRKGRFRYTASLSDAENRMPALGDFMWLLMEGARKLDEAGEAGDSGTCCR